MLSRRQSLQAPSPTTVRCTQPRTRPAAPRTPVPASPARAPLRPAAPRTPVPATPTHRVWVRRSESGPEPRSVAPPSFPAPRAGGAMDPGAVADAVETGKENVIMEALRTYNREVSGAVDVGRARRRGAGWGTRVAGRGCVSVGGSAEGSGAEWRGVAGGGAGCAPGEPVCRGGAPLRSGACGLGAPSGEPGPCPCAPVRPESLGLSAEFPELHV